MNTSAPITWTPEEYDRFGTVPMVSKHRYHERTLFDEPELVSLLDSYPRKWLQAFTMGEDPCNASEWRCVDIARETTGEELWQAVSHGRLWLNITHIEEVSDDYAQLVKGMYEHLDEHCAHLQNPRANYSTLLISSPGAQVYYHVDAEPNMLWHLRGQKRVWIYPAMDTRLVPQNLLEDIYAGEIDENLPFDPAFDEVARDFLLSPGDVASWPHNGPHRIVNQDMNVSLATSYYTPTIYKRQYVQLANRFVLRGLGLKSRSMAEDGVLPAVKRFTYRAANKIRPFTRRDRSASYITDLQVDPHSPSGLRKLDKPVIASFSKKSERSQLDQPETQVS
ncbi:hypothetical protein ACUNV4_04870 [Granulosicoccus sp. 3-233]|uniref:hypothetical protein n=1 Tax=Granulosicoccus sp. 3-233 TaxID=3417969 RepID=UPI003D3506EF